MKEKYSGVFCILLSAVFFSISGVLIKSIPWSSLSINAARSALAAVVMWIYMKKTGHVLVVNKTTVVGAVCVLLMNMSFVIATKMTSAANAIVLQFTSPVWIIWFMWLIWRQRPRRADLIACFFVFLGVICFFFDEISAEGMVGNVIAIFSGIMNALTFMLKTWKNSDFYSSVFLNYLGAVVIGLPFLLQETVFAPVTIACVLVLGIFQLGLAFVLLAKGMETVHPVTAVLVSAIEPILNPIWVALVLKETIGPVALVGAVIVMVTLVIYNVQDAKRQAAAAS